MSEIVTPRALFQKVIKYVKFTTFIKDKLIFQINKQIGRVTFLEKIWNDELEEMLFESYNDKSKQGRDM